MRHGLLAAMVLLLACESTSPVAPDAGLTELCFTPRVPCGVVLRRPVVARDSPWGRHPAPAGPDRPVWLPHGADWGIQPLPESDLAALREVLVAWRVPGLDLRGQATREHLGLAAELPDLAWLDASRSVIEAGALRALAGRPLSAISLARCSLIPPDHLSAFIEGLTPRLRSLDLAGQHLDGGQLAALLDRCPSLASLGLQAGRLAPDAWALLGQMTGLRRLDLSQLAGGPPARVLAEAATAWRWIECLRLGSTRADDTVLAVVGRSYGLRTLDVSHCAVTGRGLAALARCATLTELDVSGCSRLKADDFRVFEDHPRLERIRAFGTDVPGRIGTRPGCRVLSNSYRDE